MTNEQFLNLVSLIDMEDAQGLQEKINYYKEIETETNPFNINKIEYGKHISEFAIKRGNNKILETLIENGANVESTWGFTPPLILAAKSRHSRLTKTLLANGANPNVLKGGVTPLHLSILHNLEVFNLLLNSKNIKVNIKGASENTPLHIAASNNKLEAVNLLIAKKAQINEQNINGKTALHFAIAAADHDDKAEIIIKLLLNGADLEIENNDGISPLAALNTLFELDATLHSKLEAALTIKWLESKSAGQALVPKLYFYPNNMNGFNDNSLVALTANVIEEHIGTNPLPLQTFKKHLPDILKKLKFNLEEPTEETINKLILTGHLSPEVQAKLAAAYSTEKPTTSTTSLMDTAKEEVVNNLKLKDNLSPDTQAKLAAMASTNSTRKSIPAPTSSEDTKEYKQVKKQSPTLESTEQKKSEKESSWFSCSPS